MQSHKTVGALARRCAAVALGCSVLVAPALAADAADARYAKERADCEAGRTSQDRATCLKEAGAAKVEAKRKGLENSGSMRQNAIDRCNVVPAKDKADCLARVEGPIGNQRTVTSGSVAGGGVLKETITTTPGTVVIVPAPPTPPVSGPMK